MCAFDHRDQSQSVHPLIVVGYVAAHGEIIYRMQGVPQVVDTTEFTSIRLHWASPFECLSLLMYQRNNVGNYTRE